MQKYLKSISLSFGLLFSSYPTFAQTSEPIPSVATDSYLYLRCNATSWEVNLQSRLQPGSESYLREISFDVKEQWMVDAGDDCILTETPEIDAWGAWQHNYGGQLSFLKVPESTRLRLQANTDDNVNFKLRYPSLGRYRFILNVRDGYFSVRKDAPAQSGEISWTLPGNMLSDFHGNLFLSNYFPENSVSLVNAATGLPQWTYAAENYISLYGNCSTSDRVFITLTGRVVALSLKTGREIWSTDLNGALTDAYGYLTCYPNNDQVFLSYGSDRTTLVSLSKDKGEVLWSWTAEAYAGIMGVDARRIFISTYQSSETALVALNKRSGKELWKAQPGSGYYTIGDDSSLYLVDSARVSGIDASTGRSLWTYQGTQSESLWTSFELNRLFIHEKSRISNLDKKSGQVLWSYDYSRFVDQYPYAQVLKAGVVLVRANDYSTNSSKQIALNGRTGELLWERDEPSTSGYLSEDNLIGTWVINGKTISAIEPWNGQIKWSFTLPSTEPMENIMSVLERDDSRIYVAYGLNGSKYPPMGVLALDATTGRKIWQNWLESSLYRVGSDSQLLILNAGYYGSTKALKK